MKYRVSITNILLAEMFKTGNEFMYKVVEGLPGNTMLTKVTPDNENGTHTLIFTDLDDTTSLTVKDIMIKTERIQ